MRVYTSTYRGGEREVGEKDIVAVAMLTASEFG